jgi:homoserine dehydrogenase
MSNQKKPVRIALLGCGTVGGGVVRLVAGDDGRLAEHVGAPIEIAHVLVRDPSKARVPELNPALVTTDANAVLSDDSVDVVVEIMGGEEPAFGYVERAMRAKKSVVSANKYLLSRRGPALVALAAEMGVDLAFEASVGGGIPVIRTLRDALTSDRVESVHAILNGTCNYILTRMRAEGSPFPDILEDAQRLGYAEKPDPSLDVDGHDAAQKLVVLSMLAFGAEVDPKQVYVEGIRAIDGVDFRFAERFGFNIKHLCIGRVRGEALELRAHPAMVPLTSVIGNTNDVLNCIYIRGRALGPCLLIGRGAGDLPTAVSVVADIADVARSRVQGQAGLATRGIRIKPRALVPMSEVRSRYYLRFDVADQSGVLAFIAGALGDEGVSIEQMVQERRDEARGGGASVLMITHEATEGSALTAFRKIEKAPFMKTPPRLIRIEDV